MSEFVQCEFSISFLLPDLQSSTPDDIRREGSNFNVALWYELCFYSSGCWIWMPSRKVKFCKLKYASIFLGIRYLWMPNRKVKFCKFPKGFAERKAEKNCFSESISAVGGHSCLTLIRLPSSNTTTPYILQYIPLLRFFHKTVHFIAFIFYLFQPQRLSVKFYKPWFCIWVVP